MSQANVPLNCSLVTLLASAVALRDLELDACVPCKALALCCVLSQITWLDIDSIKGPVTEAEINTAFYGLSSLETLDVGIRGEPRMRVCNVSPADADTWMRSCCINTSNRYAVQHPHKGRPPLASLCQRPCG